MQELVNLSVLNKKLKIKMTNLKQSELTILTNDELIETCGGVDPAEGSYAAGYAIGSWFREMYNIWSYGLTHLTDR
jgi:hypothetical protein